ncbi:hypothetical protein HMPREF1624_08361 [Sporothrix schenckii ATCC 58251]|uniref:Uncharacterized protein n=1 Tax=Sporothrix schenckii (strain ATCC 58251 / de Perez 2211183) TaxID=1391915 RepID=U7PJP9_SPOS1|nr:hypothetical protein HMPREF1624_08361 [Sporothrix schenckii ATCC 58251]
MAAFFTTANSAIMTLPVEYGRSGYNGKPDDEDETKDKGRSGYNKGDKDDDDKDE